MPGEILVRYEEVYGKTAQLRRRVESGLMEMDNAYRQAQAPLRDMDGSANGALLEAMAENQKKARAAAEVLTGLLSFIETSARQTELNDRMTKRAFALTSSTRRLN